MADFFSQFQVHPPQDFNLGGFQQDPTYTGPTGAASAGMGVDTAHPMQLPDWAKFGNYAPNDPYPTPDPRLLPQQPGSDFGMKDPMKPIPPGAPSSGMGYSNQTGQLYGPLANGIGNWMQGRPAAVERMASGLSPQQLSGVAGSLGAGIGQPENPSQQSGMVLMQSPDGLHMQNVPQEHVAHYTGLGATQVNGQQLTGSSYGGGNG